MRRLGLIFAVVLTAGVLMGASSEAGTFSLDALPGGVSVVLLVEVLIRQRAHNEQTNSRLKRIETHLKLEPTP